LNTKETFAKLASVDCRKYEEKKNGLTYLSWAYAWSEVCKVAESVSRTVYETANGRNYWDDGRTAWVKVGVTVNGIEHIDYLPVMDHRNKAIPLEQIDSFSVNKAIQRSTVKAIALHGLGLNIYAGEDLPLVVELPELHDCTKLVDWARGQGMSIAQAIESAEHKYKVSDEMKTKIANLLTKANNPTPEQTGDYDDQK
jgi:hypothetical protein